MSQSILYTISAISFFGSIISIKRRSNCLRTENFGLKVLKPNSEILYITSKKYYLPRFYFGYLFILSPVEVGYYNNIDYMRINDTVNITEFKYIDDDNKLIFSNILNNTVKHSYNINTEKKYYKMCEDNNINDDELCFNFPSRFTKITIKEQQYYLHRYNPLIGKTYIRAFNSLETYDKYVLIPRILFWNLIFLCVNFILIFKIL